ncbi:hypothetical protein [Candidatus Vidania fulgoroideorum]
MRKGHGIRRLPRKDCYYNSVVVSKVINMIMMDGRKSCAEKIFYQAMMHIRNVHKINPYKVLIGCLCKGCINIEIKNHKIGGNIVCIPRRVSIWRSIFLTIRNMLKICKERRTKMHISISNEIYSTYMGESESIKKKLEVYKQAEKNRAFAHYIK